LREESHSNLFEQIFVMVVGVSFVGVNGRSIWQVQVHLYGLQGLLGGGGAGVCAGVLQQDNAIATFPRSVAAVVPISSSGALSGLSAALDALSVSLRASICGGIRSSAATLPPVAAVMHIPYPSGRTGAIARDAILRRCFSSFGWTYRHRQGGCVVYYHHLRNGD
jgi:hypothetical protein